VIAVPQTAPDGLSQPAHVCTSGYPFEEFVHDPAVPFFYWPRFRAWGITQVVNRSFPDRWWEASALQKVGFCPWCGRQFPRPLNREWVEALEARGLRPGSPDIPAEFLTDRWWRDLGHDRDDHVDDTGADDGAMARSGESYRLGSIAGRVVWLGIGER
jgi:hypothetical protein